MMGDWREEKGRYMKALHLFSKYNIDNRISTPFRWLWSMGAQVERMFPTNSGGVKKGVPGGMRIGKKEEQFDIHLTCRS